MRRALLFAMFVAACGSDEQVSKAPDGSAGSAGSAGGDGGVDGSAGTDAGVDAAQPDADAPEAAVATGISLSLASMLETETNVAAAADGRVATAWIGIGPAGKSHIGYVISSDDGASWPAPSQISSPDGRVSSDPVVAVGPDSSFYLTWVGFQRDSVGTPFDMRIYVAKAAAGATQFGPSVDVTGAVASDQVDKPWITVAQSGNVYITWFDTGAPRMRIAVSEDGGTSFSIYDIDDGLGFRNLIYPCVDETTGRLYVVYHPGDGIGLRYSDDQGKTWPQATAVASTTDPDAMFDDPTCVAHGGQVWVSYGVGTDTIEQGMSLRSNRLRVAHSSDAGNTIDNRWFAEDPAAGTKFLHPQLARDDAGTLHIVYYAGGEADPDPNGSVRLSHSTDGGTTWAPSTIVQQPIVFTRARSNQLWLGDYIGLYARGSTLYVTYADNTSGFSHVRFFSQ